MPIAGMMRPAAVILPAALFTCILALWAFQAAPVRNEVPSDDSCSIEGRVVNSVTGAPVAQATLFLGRAGDSGQRTLDADDSGRFAVRNLKPGRFLFIAGGGRYIHQQLGAMGVAWSGNDPLVLSAGNHLRNLTFRLMPEGVIAGRLLDEQGRPLPGASAVVLKRTYEYGEEDWRTAGTAKADVQAGSGLAGSLRASISWRQRPGSSRQAPPPQPNSPRRD